MTAHSATPVPPPDADGGRARRARGAALLLGAVLIVVLIRSGTLSFSWLPLLLGLTYLAAAGLSRSRGTLWGPGLVVSSVGLAAGLWVGSGRSPDSFQFLALSAMALGLGGVLAALLHGFRGVRISPMSIALPVLLFGAFALVEQQAVRPVAGNVYLYSALLALWGAVELRPARG